jgi:enoyl-CoA hydratase/carnithine racemase
MNHYTTTQTQTIHSETFAFIEVAEAANVLTITLNREQKKNALHPQMMNEIAFALQYAHHQKSVWAVVIQAKGTVFCAGADLAAFMGNLGEFNSSIPAPNEEVLMGEIFRKVHKPIIAKITGDVYAGGFFFLTGSTYVVALEGVKLGLPEVKRGLYPFQVMAALLNVMPARKVVDWCIRGYNMSTLDAESYGLITHLATPDTIDQIIFDLIDDLKQNSPSAIRLGLAAFDKITTKGGEQAYLLEMLQKTIQTNDGQEGLTAFREKRKPNWTGE